MNLPIVVYEDASWEHFLPLVYTRGVFDLLCGMDSLLAKIQQLQTAENETSSVASSRKPKTKIGLWCRDSIAPVLTEQKSLPVNQSAPERCLFLNGRGIWKQLPKVEGTGSWVGVSKKSGQVVAVHADPALAARLTPATFLVSPVLPADHPLLVDLPQHEFDEDVVELMDWPWNLIHANDRAIEFDWRVRRGAPADVWGQVMTGSHVLAPDSVFIGAGAQIKPCVVIDAENGPVWIGENVEILPHSFIQGPAYIGDDSLIQPGSVVHAGTTIGPRCKVGGEIETSIIQGFSNKQHDGFLGHSYIGSWVNIAADCINSDLKNTYGPVRVPINGQLVETGEMFVGMLCGDYSKLGINVSFPTGAVIGFCSSVVGPHSPKFVPSFSWFDDGVHEAFESTRAIEVARRVMARRQHEMTSAQECLFKEVRRISPEIEVQTP
ncbi:putative sugar nucleotidyl transferase [Thalassoroseus pseudoceratinae]|uniref:putative sugar nucleotidyl transferase n=1 Tax=Thalassoroseus pseudoceratinae TaxID=2713176 RepID=UPI00141D9BF0|nr:putative sugar nucleotidyl transferase [Thalassoroseus pseudoceratinae]